MVAGVRDVNGEVVKRFLPMSLRWSHANPPTSISRVPRDLFRHCDLGRFQLVTYTQQPIQRPVFVFDTIVQPNPVARGEMPNVIEPGEYEVEVRLSGDNTRTMTRKWILRFDDTWSDDEDPMLRDHISIEPA